MQPAITVKGGKVSKNPKFVKAASENRTVDEQAPANNSPSVKSKPIKPTKMQDSEPPLRNDTSSNQVPNFKKQSAGDPSHPAKVNSYDDDGGGTGSGSDTAIMGTRHCMGGGHCGYGR